MITLTLIFAVVTMLPVKWAADFTDSQNTGMLTCLLASLVAPVLAIVAFRLSSGGFIGFLLAYLALVTTYVTILRVPARSIIGFSVLQLALQGAAVVALISFGLNIDNLLLG